ncbi:MAG: dTMP kinase [Acidimicrobiaceae bacterium]|nr:dTMP kinase [Acidimicrobiaceae bacterium]MDB4818007.1 dTMP kinase [Acidimicrobiales bacterium]MDC1389278.1 dTMP kinase [Acidimicrobiales bacterium]HAY69484.1 dTMP kinase [Acidimicrobiaceae bacterium]
MTGRFIAFEGGEGSGKSTQARRVAEARGALLTRQPGGTEIGASIRELLLSPDTTGLSDRAEALLMAADRAQHVDQMIRPALEAGQDVICDRYVSSSLAYQGAGRALGIDAVLGLSEFAVGDTWPDVNVLLDVPASVGLARIDGPPDRLEQQGVGFHERVRETFLALAATNPDRWLVIDGTQPVAAVAAELDAGLHERFGWTL